MPVRLLACAELSALYSDPVQRRSLLNLARNLLRDDAQALLNALDPPSCKLARQAAHRSKGTLMFLGTNTDAAAKLLDDIDDALWRQDLDTVGRLRPLVLAQLQAFEDEIDAYVSDLPACASAPND